MSKAEEMADRVREIVADAERHAQGVVGNAEERAAKIVSDAEADAARIRDEAEAQASERIERAQAALRELAGETPPPPTPTPDPMPDPPGPDPEPPAPTPDPGPPGPPAPGPHISADDETSAQPPSDADGAAEVPAASGNGDDAAARLTAMKMALDGAGRDEIEAELASKFGARDRSSLLDDVLARAGS